MHEAMFMFSSLNFFWIISNSQPVIYILIKLNGRGKATSISRLDFSPLYAKIPRNN